MAASGRCLCRVVGVAASDQEPVLLLAVEVSRHERPHPLEALSVKPHLEAPVWLVLEELIGAPVPDLDGAGAVGALRDLALEGSVVERVILDVDRERLLALLQRNALRHRPGGEHTVALEPEVVVEGARLMPLDDEDRLLAPRRPAERLGRRAAAFCPVRIELRHRSVVSR